MGLSVLDLFSIGVGPSSSHTVGPMRAAVRFLAELEGAGVFARVARVETGLFGSLGATGIGHGSDSAVIVGLSGFDPEQLDPAIVPVLVARAREEHRILLAGERDIRFEYEHDLTLHRKLSLPGHPNGMRMTAYDTAGRTLLEREYYSIGGGFVVASEELGKAEPRGSDPLPFASGDELLERCAEAGGGIARVMLINETARRSEEDLRAQLLRIWQVMQECVENGCNRTEPLLPGKLGVQRRAPSLLRRLQSAAEVGAEGSSDGGAFDALEWVNLYALAVNEENASGGRVVTAPTNGAAGILPAVLHYYTRFVRGADEDRVVEFLLTAGAIGMLFKRNASISGAELGCQAEVGSACSMAAGALCAVLGGTPEQVENAAEIGLEHNLGLTCDPVGGLVQVPCIERNAIASVKAINAARLALAGDGSHLVSLDQAIETMRETGLDMKTKYKETSRGGLAVNVIEC